MNCNPYKPSDEIVKAELADDDRKPGTSLWKAVLKALDTAWSVFIVLLIVVLLMEAAGMWVIFLAD